MEPSRPAVAEQALQLALLEHPEPAGEVERAIGDAECRIDNGGSEIAHPGWSPDRTAEVPNATWDTP